MSTMKMGCLQSGTAPEHCAAPASELEGMARQLEMTGDFRVLRRLRTRSKYGEPDGCRLHRGIYADVETTGLDPVNDDIIELSLLPFDFASDGRVFSIHEPFERFRDPGRAIPDVVTGITGITNEMVAGASVDPAEVEAFLDGAVLVVAHNASFDRPFAERLCGAFADLPWACSFIEVPWSREGYTDGAKLSHLAAAAGFFFDGHRASADCRAGLELLARRLPRSGRTALDLLLTSVRTPRWRVAAVGAPFELRHVLKSRGYRWQAGDDGRLRAWVVEVADDALEAEESFLSREIYGGRDADIDVRRIDAFDRYSDRG